MLQRRKELSKQDYEKYSAIITEQVLRLPAYRNAAHLHIYCSFNKEVNTWDIIYHALRTGKSVIVPVMVKKIMKHVRIDEHQEFTPDAFGIPTPTSIRPEQWCAPEIFFQPTDVIIVPVVAFDHHLYRLGYGRGYYDQFLSKTPGLKIGIAFSFQLWGEELPREQHDVPLNLVVTEQRIFTKNERDK